MHNHLDWLPLAFAEHCRAPLLTTVHGFSGAGILPAYAPGPVVATSRSPTPTGPPSSTTSPRSTTASTSTRCRSPRTAGAGLVAFGRIHPDKGTHTAIEIARRAGRPLTICGIVQDERYFAEQVAPHIDGDRVVFLGSVGPATARRDPGRQRRPAAPDRLRRAVRAVGGGVDGLRHAGGRVPARVHARGRRRGRDGSPGAHRRRRPSTRSTRSPAIDRAACRARARQRFGADRMVDDYLARLPTSSSAAQADLLSER